MCSLLRLQATSRTSTKRPRRSQATCSTGTPHPHYLGQRVSFSFKTVRGRSTLAKAESKPAGNTSQDDTKSAGSASSPEAAPTATTSTEATELAVTHPKSFSFELALLAAAFSFETYSEPRNSRWERGSKGSNHSLLRVCTFTVLCNLQNCRE